MLTQSLHTYTLAVLLGVVNAWFLDVAANTPGNHPQTQLLRKRAQGHSAE